MPCPSCEDAPARHRACVSSESPSADAALPGLCSGVPSCSRSPVVNLLKTSSRALVALLVLVLGTAGFALPAAASPLSQKRSEARAAQTKLNALRSKAEQAAEAYNEARDKYGAISAKVRATRSRISKLKAEQKTLQTALGNRADEMYRSDGILGIIGALVSAQSLQDVTMVIEVLQRVSEQDARTVAKLKTTRAELEVEERALAAAEADALAQANSMKASKKEADAKVADAKRVLGSLRADVRELIDRQEAAQEAAARARWLASQNDSSNDSSGGSSSGGSSGNSGSSGGSSSARGRAAVNWAMKKLGSWYQWGAAGPSRFDCSGLTQWAYARVGVSLPHYSRAQYSSGRHIARGDLQPGDLVFFGSPIHHVGMYVGGGNFIEAPYTGARVRITSLGNRSDYVGATRP